MKDLFILSNYVDEREFRNYINSLLINKGYVKVEIDDPRIADYDKKNDNDIIRSTYRSLAYSYKEAIDELETITNNKYDYLYIVGGGAQNKFLNKCIMEFIKDKEIIILPIEATSIGNLHVQMES